jgi:hypothetical protein
MREREDHSGSMENRSQSQPPYKSMTPMYSLVFNAVAGLRGLVHKYPTRYPTCTLVTAPPGIKMTKHNLEPLHKPERPKLHNRG